MTPMSKTDINMLDEDQAEIELMGYQAVDTTISELASIGAGTACGGIGNKCFIAISNYSKEKYSKRKVKCWFHPNDPFHGGPCVTGMVHIKIQTDTAAEKLNILRMLVMVVLDGMVKVPLLIIWILRWNNRYQKKELYKLIVKTLKFNIRELGLVIL